MLGGMRRVRKMETCGARGGCSPRAGRCVMDMCIHVFRCDKMRPWCDYVYCCRCTYAISWCTQRTCIVVPLCMQAS
jgi:hypothetical protein